MSRPTDHHQPEDYHLPMYHTNTKNYHQHHYCYDSPSPAPQDSHGLNPNTNTTVATNSSSSGSRLITIKPASCLSASSSSLSPSSTSSSSGFSSSKKKRLQVSWHPSVNQRQAAKRDRQIAYLLAVLFFFSSITMILFHYSECDIATGQCQQQQRRSNLILDTSSASVAKSFESSFPPSHGKKRLPSVTGTDALRAKGLLMDADVTVSVNGRLKSSSTDSGRTPRNPHDLDEYNLEHNGAFDDEEANSATEDLSMDRIAMDSRPSQDEEVMDTTGYAAVDYGLDDDTSLETTEPSNENGNGDDGQEHTMPMNDPNATPQEAYVDIWNDTPDTLSKQAYIESEQAQHQHQQPLLRRLDPSTKYMTYLPYAGLTSQFYGMLHAFMLAKSLDRTLILPPITISSYDDDMDSAGGSSAGSSGPSRQNQQPWSTYFDLSTFMDLTGVKVIELHELREPDMMIMGAMTESLSCHVTCGMGSLRPLDFTAKEFLEQWKFDLSIQSPLQLEDETTEYGELVPALRGYDSEQMLCITNSYKVSVPMKEDWERYGQYLYFTPTMERFFGGVLQKLGARNPQKQQQQALAKSMQQQQNEGEEEEERYTQDDEDGQSTTTDKFHNNGDFMNSALIPNRDLYAFQKNNDLNNGPPGVTGNSLDNAMTKTTTLPLPATPFIAIHARRGAEFIDYCQQNFQHALHTCLPTTQELASALHTLLLENPSLRGLPVFVCTNEERPRELAAFRLLGWQVLDHKELRSGEQLGVFGAKMVDQMAMAQAEMLIGVRMSTFSRVGSYRQEDWYGRKVVFM
ncbi:hypothetical protein BG011_004185 [Mortierella polycephala]|uniref:GDP-fucose protein O-fucosyltransferase 2 n=1 Tax=Mortierella polycephala TaxID=41804 RepID=A0A9P6U330_9FUNG|nr:hypothetical protein BG011_004185 [Mortierella polycephala]